MKFSNTSQERLGRWRDTAVSVALGIYDRLCLVFVCMLLAVVAIVWPDLVRSQLKHG